MTQDVAVRGETAVQTGLPRSETLARLAEARELITKGTATQLIDALIYADAVAEIAREKRAQEIAREAVQTRIDAARRLGEMINEADQPASDALYDLIPTRFNRCDELARIPTRLYKSVRDAMLESGSSCSITGVIRNARVKSLTRVEEGIYQAFDETIWISEGGKRRTHIHHGGIEEARRRLGLSKHPNARRLDEAYSQARIAAHSLSLLGSSFTGEVRDLVAEAELAQAKVAEALDRALKAMVAS